ncbi:DUF7261 family protein [Natronobiforma cellulositropha]|uniref:DUF7261 family protein n=1 Tax=Natronobiforma cellulositropha TaxID=1679076 RepID=UPI0021D5BC83|nr:hypothetical protein [Natronobiforma cellulositropha]
MVSVPSLAPARPDATRRERAQLVLIAAIAVAFIILGVVVVLNSVLYTQTISSSTSIEQTGDAHQTELELERNLRGLVQETNRNGGDVDAEVAAFLELYERSSGESRPVAISAEMVDEEPGVLFQEEPSSPLNDEGEVFDSTLPREFGQLLVTIDLDQSDSNGRLELNLSDDTTVWFTRVSASDTVTVEVVGGPQCEITPQSSESVTIDVLRGEANGEYDSSDCLDVASAVQGSYDSLQFEDPAISIGDLYGSYEVVVAGGEPGIIPSHDGREVAWALELEYTSDSSDLSYERSLPIEVYGDRP